jgi:hypothetical protein
MGRLRNNIIKRYRNAIDDARKALGSDATVYYKTGNKIAYTGLWDDINKEVVDIEEAPDGNFYLDEIKSKIIKVTTSRVGVSLRYIPYDLVGGNLDINDVFISAKLEDVLIDASDKTSKTIFHQATKIIINEGANEEVLIPKTSPLKYGLAGDLYSCGLIARIDGSA